MDRLFDPLRRRAAADAIFYNASRFAEFSIGWHALSLLGAAVSPTLRPHAARMVVSLGVESLVVNQGIKRIFRRERPDLIEGSPHLRRPTTHSFPSGHASSGAMAAVLLSDAVPRLRPVWWAAAAAVATSRVHTRMHHASDITAGAVVGSTFGLVAKRIWPL
ncbi:MAG: phosphatase PAP2 family protein [Acidimicrobiales bacterium]